MPHPHSALLVASAAAAVLLCYALSRRRRAKRPAPERPEQGGWGEPCPAASSSMAQHLCDANASRPHVDGSPIYTSLTKQQPYVSERLKLDMRQPDEFESLFMRLCQKDAAKGCIDPELIGVLRDTAVVTVRLDGSGGEQQQRWLELQLPAFMAHLANPLALCDPEMPEETTALWGDGSWTGTLIWDSAVHVTELLLASEAWRASIRGASVVELGCGLGLPGLVCALLGAAPVLLTDRGAVAALAEEGCRTHSALAAAHGVTLEWEAAALQALVDERLSGAPPGLIIACDCIFAPMFGSTFLLLE
eukprot:2571970-Prymnesium_polylepis.1